MRINFSNAPAPPFPSSVYCSMKWLHPKRPLQCGATWRSSWLAPRACSRNQTYCGLCWVACRLRTCRCVCVSVCVRACVHVYVRVHACVCVCVWAHVCAYVSQIDSLLSCLLGEPFLAFCWLLYVRVQRTLQLCRMQLFGKCRCMYVCFCVPRHSV